MKDLIECIIEKINNIKEILEDNIGECNDNGNYEIWGDGLCRIKSEIEEIENLITQ